MMDDFLRVVGSAHAILPMVSGWCGASLPFPEGPRVWQQDSITVPDRTLGCGRKFEERKSRRIKHQEQKQAVQALRVQEQGLLKPAMDGTRPIARAQRVQELTEPTPQLSAAYLGADVSHCSMPVSTPNTSARREAQVSLQEPSDQSTEQRTANRMAAGVFKVLR